LSAIWSLAEGGKALPFHINTPELASQTALSKTGKVHLTDEWAIVREVFLIDVILVERSDPDWKVIMPVYTGQQPLHRYR
jgi:hypothetical protein